MSEDTDERMDRATRIRQMREGQRESATDAENGDDDGGDEDWSSETSSNSGDASNGGTTSSSPDTSPTPDATTDDRDRSADSAADSSSESTEQAQPESGESAASSQPNSDGERQSDSEANENEPAPAGDSTEETDAESTTDSAVDQVAASAAQPAPDTETADDLDEEAAAAAERAAQAAASVTGDGSGGATSQAQAGVETVTGTAAEADQPSGTTASAAPMQGPTGVELPDEESIQAAVADEVLDSDAGDTAEPATGRGVDAQETAADEETVRVLEFTLGDEHYCLDIAHVEEIVKRESITRVPNTPEYVEGVVDLRGQITTILDPKLLLDIDQEGPESLLVVFAPEAFEDQGAIGWVVDEVRQVAPIARSEVSSAPVDADYIEGVIDRDDEEAFVIWTNPEVAIRLATGERESGE